MAAGIQPAFTFARSDDLLANPVSGRKPKETGLFVSFSAQEGRSE